MLHFKEKAVLLSLHYAQFLKSGLESQFLLILLDSPIKNKDLINSVTKTITNKSKLMIPKKTAKYEGGIYSKGYFQLAHQKSVKTANPTGT